MEQVAIAAEREQRPMSQGFSEDVENVCEKVLVVEDEVELAEVLEFNLMRRGWKVLSARDGLEACRVIGREKPDLILLDLMLPLLNGWEVCRMVRSHHDPLVAKTPIIMLSAMGTADDRVKGYELGADLYLPKPYAMKEVIIKVKHLLQQRQEHKQLEKKLESLQDWTELQDTWQQAMFHEMRNQLVTISGMAEHLKSSTAELPQDRSVRFAGQIADSSNYLGSIAENYLLVRKIESHSRLLPTEPMILQYLLSDLLQLFKPLAEKKACEIEFECPEAIMLSVHPVGLKVIISSLLDNALKYSPVDSRISVTVKEDATQVSLQIQDDGPGIPEGEWSKVFEKFYRGSTAEETNSGSGLGLYIARTLAQSMGGALQLLENGFPGCCLELTLPGIVKH